jgi:hypothetical protein
MSSGISVEAAFTIVVRGSGGGTRHAVAQALCLAEQVGPLFQESSDRVVKDAGRSCPRANRIAYRPTDTLTCDHSIVLINGPLNRQILKACHSQGLR